MANPNLALPVSNIMPYTVNTITSKFVVKLLKHVAMIRECSKMIRDERRRLIKGLNSIEGIKVFDSEANFVTFNPHKNADQIYGRLLEKEIIVKNLRNLPVIGHCLRATVGLPDLNDRSLESLSGIMDMMD